MSFAPHVLRTKPSSAIQRKPRSGSFVHYQAHLEGLNQASTGIAHPVHAYPTGVAAKLEIGDVNDPLEREADSIADQVMRPAGAIAAERGPVVAQTAEKHELRRQCESCAAEEEDAEIHRAPAAGPRGGPPSTDFSSRVHGRAGRGGSPLLTGVRNFLEPRLGTDLGDVRIHSDREAGALAKQINARAFTHNQDIFFGHEQLQPQTPSGMWLLAHEVAHTLQARRRSDAATGTIHSNRAQQSVVRRAPASFCEVTDFSIFGVSSREWYDNAELGKIRYSTAGQDHESLAVGDSGPAVTLVQNVLREWGCSVELELLPVYGADGKFGKETHEAVREFQLAHMLQPDGVVGPNTVALLDHFVMATPVTTNPTIIPTTREHNCDDAAITMLQKATTQVIAARARLEAFVANGTPQRAGPIFEDFFGPISGAEHVTDTLEDIEQILDEARPGVSDREAGEYQLVCTTSEEEPSCQGASALHRRGQRLILLCMDKLASKSDDFIAGAIVHEAVHAALPDDVDAYTHLRLYEIIKQERAIGGGTVATRNPDSIAGFVLAMNSDGNYDTHFNGPSASDSYHVEETDGRLMQARRAIAYAESWVKEGTDELERFEKSVLAQGKKVGGLWASVDVPTQMLLMSDAGVANVAFSANVISNNCQALRGQPRFPHLSCPASNAKPTNFDIFMIPKIRDRAVHQMRNKIVEREIEVFEHLQVGTPPTEWVLSGEQRILQLGPQFFSSWSLRTQVVEILRALLRAQGVSKADARNTVAYLRDYFFYLYGDTLGPL